MKRIISTTAFLLALVTSSIAQGNLQFNQVVAADINAAALPYASTVIGTITVPAGKVWKVESTSYTYTQSGNTWPMGGTSYVVRIGSHIAYCQNSGHPQQYLPLWLPAGTYSVTALGFDEDVTFSYSAIEFNVVP